jgi:hypothetical protein
MYFAADDLLYLERPGVSYVHSCKSHEQPETERVLFVVRQPRGPVEIQQPGKFFLRQKYHDRLRPRHLVGVERVFVYQPGPHRGVIIHTYNAHVFAYRAGTISQLVAQISSVPA